MLGKIRTKTPGLKAECLKKAFDALFEGCKSVPKNSIGIYTPDESYRCKRAVCFSGTALVLSKFDVYTNFKNNLDCIGSLARKSLIWGVCGQTPTRANELEEKKFLLCYKKEKKFIAAAVVDTDKISVDGESLRVTCMNGNERNINDILDMMKAERSDFNQKKLMHQAMKRARCLTAGLPGRKIRKISNEKFSASINSAETDSDSGSVEDDGVDDDDDDDEIIPEQHDDITPTETVATPEAIYDKTTVLLDTRGFFDVDSNGEYQPLLEYDVHLNDDNNQHADLNKMYYDVLGHEEAIRDCKSPVIYFRDSEEEQEYADNPFLQSFYEMVASAKHANVPLF